jgi:pyruvate/2-oxoglutarate dehydrogenase complex dihydrolipoamide acyltransferase (E2) component
VFFDKTGLHWSFNASLLQWFKQEGDTIQEFDALCEVRSDKAAVTITSPFDGVITKKYYAVGDVAKTGLPLIDVKMAGTLQVSCVLILSFCVLLTIV